MSWLAAVLMGSIRATASSRRTPTSPRAITGAGVTWIGPPPEAIEVMGDKISSRLAAQRARSAERPGTTEVLTSAARGGRLRRPVRLAGRHQGRVRRRRPGDAGGAEAAEAAAALESAQREAEKAFGRSESYLERYLTWPRHVEVQVFADTYGNAVYLGTRDCSAQRRHQKLIEEAPAPGIAGATLAAMGDAAVKVAKACGYVNAGTVEFIYQDGDFFFLEMNTRLQVEHPATEAVVGRDLVALQLRIAAGEPLGFTQEDVVLRGHAIEVRVNAEDPAGGRFLPSPGTITRFRKPDGFGVRVDAGYEEGDTVSQFYDNLIAKIIVWGYDREDARRRMLRALGRPRSWVQLQPSPRMSPILEPPGFHQHRAFDQLGGAEARSVGRVRSIRSRSCVRGEEPLVRRDVDVEVDGRRFQVGCGSPRLCRSRSAAPGARRVPAPGVRAREPVVRATAAGPAAGR